MRTEYKRDMNHNYLIVYGENEINTDSYQVRMLAGNVIPSLLKCRIQGMDGRFLIYFDITSKQAVNVLYEEKKMGVEDLRLIFGGFVKAMEDAAEYLINPGQFIMSPEYIYTDIEKRQIYFCMMPGYEKDIKEQFQLLTEYILPKIDHQDQDAVILGYGVYKRAMEDSFHLEHIKEELYKTQSSDVNGEKKEKINAKKTEQEMEFAEEETFPEDNENRNEFVREGEDSKEPGRLNPVGVIVPAAVLICGLAAAILKGYLPHVEMETILGVIVIAIAGIMLGLLLQAPIALILILVMSYGCGMILATIGVFFRDMEYLWSVALMLVMYTCAIFYYPEKLLKSGWAWILKYNPLYCVIDIFRCSVFGKAMNIHYFAYALIFSVVAMVIGLFCFKKKQDDFILYI